MMTITSKKGYPFGFKASACETCQGACCSGASGHVWVTPMECERIAKLLEINLLDFIARYTYKKDGRISLIECQTDVSYDCIFFDSKKRHCTVYPARPKQCRAFPFWPWNKDNLEKLKTECPGVVSI